LEVRTAADSVCEVPPPSSVDERILSALNHADHPVPAAELRALCSVRKATFYARLVDLTRAGRLVRSSEGYRLATTA
jgi:DNA-binding IclR family transcriptional regulator